MSIEIRVEHLRQRPTNRFLEWGSRNKLVRVLFRGPFEDEIEKAQAGCEEFNRMFLLEVGAFDHPTLSGEAIKNQVVSVLAGNLLEEVFHPGPHQEAGLDGKKHKLNENIQPYLSMRFPTYRNSSVGYGDITEELKREYEIYHQRERAIDLEARYILLTVVTPSLQDSEGLGIFIEDFISSIGGKPQNRYAHFINQNLRENVASRLDQLGATLNRISNPNSL